MVELQSITASNVGIIHLSDIHLSDKINPLQEKGELLFRALKDDFSNCLFIYIVVSGDIVNTGKESEYKVALTFFTELLGHLKKRYSSTQFRFVFVPGNHDCNFNLDKQVRINTIKNINHESIGNDDSVLKMCLEIQSDFWNFYSLFHNNDTPNNKIYYRIIDTIADKKMCFHCFNTAWMSQKDEIAGSLFFPTKRFGELTRRNEFDLNIAVLHHPLNWFNPNTVENNKKEFQNLLDEIASLQIIGHEHENELRKTENIDNLNSHTVCASGEVLQNQEDPTQSGFQTFFINLNNNKVRLRRYRWKKNLYQQYSEKEIILKKKAKRVVELNNMFIEELNKINIPLNFNDKQVKFSDIFVFPDLEKLTSKSENVIDDFIDSETLLDNSKFINCIFEGDSQIGKSSLLYMLFLKFYDKGFYPILLDGKDIISDNIDKIVQKAFKSQYTEDPTSYEKFKQINNDLKVLLIDDLHTSKLNEYARHNAIKLFFDLFSRTFITIDTAYGIIPQIQTEFKDICSFSIKPLGYKKRNDLVEKYLALKEPSFVNTPQIHLDKTKHTFNQLSHILGDKLIPAYPVFVLSIIQALEYQPLNLNETSYGYCYQTLIHHALNNTGVSKDDIDSYINIITELAFYMFTMKTDSISEIDFEAYYEEYRKKFVAPGFETAINKLLNSKIFKQDSGSFCFGYKSYFYFLAAKKIAEMIERPEGKAIVKELYDNLHKEKNANILVLITHHTKNHSIIEESILTSMLLFENTLPITLEKRCNYYKLLEEILNEIKQDILEMNRDPSKERQKELLAQDKLERKTNQNNNEGTDFDVNEKTMPFLKAFRSIEIIGQIIKNRKGSLEKAILKEMLIELYNTGFRMVSYLGEMIKETKDAISLKIEENISKKDTNQDIERKIYKFLQFISLQACLGVFSKFIHSLGVKELREMYIDVAKTMDTPAAKIVSFSINSYYGKINIKELEQLSKEFKGNFVALQILKARVRAYIYNNYVDYRDKQKIAEYLNMIISPAVGRKDKGY
ncbi:MAG: metallophosphoesterase [Candidatus Brocadiaceae bacterium]